MNSRQVFKYDYNRYQTISLIPTIQLLKDTDCFKAFMSTFALPLKNKIDQLLGRRHNAGNYRAIFEVMC